MNWLTKPPHSDSGDEKNRMTDCPGGQSLAVRGTSAPVAFVYVTLLATSSEHGLVYDTHSIGSPVSEFTGAEAGAIGGEPVRAVTAPTGPAEPAMQLAAVEVLNGHTGGAADADADEGAPPHSTEASTGRLQLFVALQAEKLKKTDGCTAIRAAVVPSA